MIQIRFKQEVGYLRHDIDSPAMAFALLIQLRGKGLYYNVNDTNSIIWIKTLNTYCEAMDIMNNIVNLKRMS